MDLLQDPAVTAGGGDDRRRRKRGSTMLKETETQACNATGCGKSNRSRFQSIELLLAIKNTCL